MDTLVLSAMFSSVSSHDIEPDEAIRERLQRESRLLASIDHPNVIAFYERARPRGSCS